MACPGKMSMCDCIAGLLNIFNKYSGKDGDPDTLTKDELKDLLKDEFGGLLKNADQVKVDQVFQQLDRDGSQTVDFREYMTFVCSLAVCCKECLQSGQKK
ncbi:hypothetical protein COCON_G00129640 [Conger conger]|uniref:EF-hand domain-containing protein n=1 Tax=Conger conger TaxID=82655 RepID=A0A9Q1HX51_CONCO|nr:ictacalcin-like [Conger conger]KAJ8267792.1 hypothetical protein COCON_G00129640 [Conger conger]